MRVIVAGGHGQIALRLQRVLTEEGHQAVALVRNPDHFADVRATGAEPVLCDLEQATVEEVAGHIDGADAVVFAAGAGPGSGAARKETVDRAASVLLADAAGKAGVRRFLQISAMGAASPPPPGAGDVFGAYLRAKAAAEDDLRRRDLEWTVLRPGRLTNDPGTGRVQLAQPSLPRGDISRDDVAAVIAALLVDTAGIGQTLDLVQGDTPIPESVLPFRS
jgi:uncharacterized protein YbjT (DUF2867 family)